MTDSFECYSYILRSDSMWLLLFDFYPIYFYNPWYLNSWDLNYFSNWFCFVASYWFIFYALSKLFLVFSSSFLVCPSKFYNYCILILYYLDFSLLTKSFPYTFFMFFLFISLISTIYLFFPSIIFLWFFYSYL